MSGIQIRTLTSDDWERVRSIYLEGIATGQATFETRAPSWAEWDSNHLPAPRLVATSEGRIVGWAALSPVSSRTVYAGVAEVSVYVGERLAGQGGWQSIAGNTGSGVREECYLDVTSEHLPRKRCQHGASQIVWLP